MLILFENTEVLILIYISGVRLGHEMYRVFSLALGTIKSLLSCCQGVCVYIVWHEHYDSDLFF
jgi:hypothetical protein